MSKYTGTDFDERLCCHPRSLSYDFSSKTGKIFFVEGNNCDMSGCIKLFKSIHPEVESIFTFSGEEEDTAYLKKDNKWLVVSHLDKSIINECEDSAF